MINSMETQKKSIFEEFYIVLSRELQIYHELIGAMRDKQNAIVNQDKDKIKKAILREREKSQSILKHMKLRNQLTQSFSKAKKTKGSLTTLTHIIQDATGDIKTKLNDIRHQMHLSVTEIDKLNRDNKYLLSASITHVKDLVKIFLTNGTKPHSHYEINGSIALNQKENKVLDFKI